MHNSPSCVILREIHSGLKKMESQFFPEFRTFQPGLSQNLECSFRSLVGLLEVFDALWSAQCDVVKECLVKYYELQYS